MTAGPLRSAAFSLASWSPLSSKSVDRSCSRTPLVSVTPVLPARPLFAAGYAVTTWRVVQVRPGRYRRTENADAVQDPFCSYLFNRRGEVPVTLGPFHTSGLYAWDSSAARAGSVPISTRPASSAGLHFSVLVYAESSYEDVVKARTDAKVGGKKVAARCLNRQTYRRGKVWLTLFQVSEVQECAQGLLR